MPDSRKLLSKLSEINKSRFGIWSRKVSRIMVLHYCRLITFLIMKRNSKTLHVGFLTYTSKESFSDPD